MALLTPSAILWNGLPGTQGAAGIAAAGLAVLAGLIAYVVRPGPPRR